MFARGDNGFLQRFIGLRVEARIVVAFLACVHDRAEATVVDLRTGHECRDLVLLDHLPADVVLDIRMVDVDDNHLRRAARRAAGFDRAGRPVADLQETHQAGGFAAAGQRFAFAADAGEVAARAGAVFEETRFADPQVHDAALIHQVVTD